MIGDSTYPMQSWLMQPFSYSSELTTEQQTYNYRICRAIIVAENAFKSLLMKLMKRNDMFIHNAPAVAAAARMLHNTREIHHDQFNDASSNRSHQIQGALVTYFSSN